STGAAAPGDDQGVDGWKRLIQVASPGLAGEPVFPLPTPSPQSCRTRCKSKVEPTPEKFFLVTIIFRAAEVMVALVGIWVRSNLKRARFFRPPAVVPAGMSTVAPRLL